MQGRLPKVSDFSSDHVISITPPPGSGKPVNVLILLHGLGDKHESMKLLGERIALPETVCIALQGPTPLPFDIGGYHWGDDVVFDQGSASMDPDTGFKKSTKVLLDVVKNLQDKCGYRLRDLLFFGYGQGGMAALKAALDLEEIGGIVSIGGPLPTDADTPTNKSKTPIIVLGGSSDSAITDSAVTRLKSAFVFVEHKKFKRPGDSPPRSRDEMLPIMSFLARRLGSRHGVPDGFVEMR